MGGVWVVETQHASACFLSMSLMVYHRAEVKGRRDRRMMNHPAHGGKAAEAACCWGTFVFMEW